MPNQKILRTDRFLRFSAHALVSVGPAGRLFVVAIAACFASTAAAQVRMKPQDRGRYESPKISAERSAGEREKRRYDEVDLAPSQRDDRVSKDKGSDVRQVGHSESVIVDEPGLHPAPPISWSGEVIDASCGVEASCGIAPICDCYGEHTCGVEGPMGCDSFTDCGSCGSVDSCFGCGSCDGCGDCRCRGYQFCDPNRWFGTAELLLWWRKQQYLPALVSNTDDPAAVFDPASVIYGNQGVADDMQAGGRFQVGMWLDPQRCQSLVGRIWGLGSESHSFSTNTANTPTIVRPFIDPNNLGGANDGQTGLVISGDGRTGNISVRGDSEVYGADVSMRQLWRTGLGGRVDFLYGYQHLRLNESLTINSFTTDAPPDTARTIERTDIFDVENEFHGGQVGFAGRFREGRWSWDGMFKLGFGSLRRGADLTGETVTQDDRVAPPDNLDVDPAGLLVQASNRGSHNDSTFAWIPELNLNLIYHTCHNVDLSIGYGLVVVTDAVQVHNTIDPDLQVDLGAPQTVARPNSGFRDDDYWVQGIQFGLDWWY